MAMPKYLIEASYTLDGVKGVQSGGGSARRDAIGALAQSVGGSMESLYFSFGESGVYVVVDLPDNQAAAPVAWAVNSSSAVAPKTVVLLTPEAVEAAAQPSVDCSPPGS